MELLQGVFDIDIRIVKTVEKHRSGPANGFFRAFSGLGSVYFTFFLLAGVWSTSQPLAYHIGARMLVAWIAVYGTKLAVSRKRPPVSRLGASKTPSFPSGHSATAVFMAVQLSAAIPQASVLLYVAAAAVCISRVYLGAHYPSDVVAGAGAGAALALLL